MTLGALPVLLAAVLVVGPPPPSSGQVISTGLVALIAGCGATTVFLHARNATTDAYRIAAVDATQGAEVASPCWARWRCWEPQCRFDGLARPGRRHGRAGGLRADLGRSLSGRLHCPRGRGRSGRMAPAPTMIPTIAHPQDAAAPRRRRLGWRIARLLLIGAIWGALAFGVMLVWFCARSASPQRRHWTLPAAPA
ncbi:MAG: multidrug resistance efflux transporter family protein [Acetobacteraceae bacterium]